MSLAAAARITDPIAHTSMFSLIGQVGAGLLAGIAVGFAVTLATTALLALTIGTGGLGGFVAGAVISAVIMHATGANRLINATQEVAAGALNSIFPPVVEGAIQQGSPNVFINGKSAARADGSTATCSRHPPPQLAAEGSDKVFINQQPAHRVGDQITCGSKTSGGSPNVFIGGGTVAVRPVDSELPAWLAYLDTAIGVALALCTRDWKSIPGKLACLGMGIAVSTAANAAVSAVSAVFGHPVHAPSGSKLLDGEDDTDFALPAYLPLVWKRVYSSRNRRSGSLGWGWSLPTSVRLLLGQPGEHPHVVLAPDGNEIPFTALEPGQSLTNTFYGWTLARTANDHWLARDENGLHYDFGPLDPEALGTLTPDRIEDINGNAIALHYADGWLCALIDSSGRHFHCHYHPDERRRLAAITLDGEPTPLVRYDYDEHGCLSTVTDAAGQVRRRFTWVYEGDVWLMASHTLPDGLVCRYHWQTLSGETNARVVEHTTSLGERWRAAYRLPQGDAPGETFVENQDGQRQTWTWDAKMRVLSHTDATGRTWSLAWGAADSAAPELLARTTQPNGGVWRYAYDARGNLTETRDPLGRSTCTEWRQDLPVPVKETDPDGSVREYHYDHRGNLLVIEAPEGRQQFVRGRHGELLRWLDPAGNQRQWTWNGHGQVLTETDCSGHLTQHAYDTRGRLIAIADALGQRSQYRYDVLDRLSEASDPNGAVRHYAWTPAGRLAAWRDPLGRVTRYAYDAAGQLTEQSEPGGGQSRQRFGPGGDLQALTDAAGQTVHFAHDGAGRVVRQTGIDGYVTEVERDALGLPAHIRQGMGGEWLETRLRRDLLGRLVEQEDADTLTRYTYDAAGRLTGIARHLAPRLIFQLAPPPAPDEPPPLLDEIRLAYDAAGRLAEETTVIHRLHADGGWRALPEPRTRTVLQTRDALGNLATLTMPGGQEIRHLRYGSGHLHQINWNGDAVCDFERDALHRETGRVQGRLASHYELDPVGCRLRQRSVHARQGVPFVDFRLATPEENDARHWHRLGHPHARDILVKGYRYDAAGQLTARRDPFLGEQHYSHTANGEIQATENLASPRYVPPGEPNVGSDILGRGQHPLHPELRETFAWDRADNALPAAYVEAPPQGRVEHNRVRVWRDIRYDYDAHGRLIRKQAGSRETLELTWNVRGQLVQTRQQCPGQPARVAHYHYDALGRRIAKTSYQDITWFIWNGMMMIQEEVGQRRRTYLYEDDGQYEPLARIDHDAEEAALPEGGIAYFHNDVNGAPEELTDMDGNILWRGRYATWGRLALELRQGQREVGVQNLRFQGQYFDDESGLHYNTFRYYDPDCGRYVSADPIGVAGGFNLYRYAPDPIGWIDPWGWCVAGKGVQWKSRRVFSRTDTGLKDHARRHSNLSAADYLRRGQENVRSGRMLKGGGKYPDVSYWVRKIGDNDYSLTILNHRREILSIDTWRSSEGSMTWETIEHGLARSGVTPPRGFWDRL